MERQCANGFRFAPTSLIENWTFNVQPVRHRHREGGCWMFDVHFPIRVVRAIRMLRSFLCASAPLRENIETALNCAFFQTY